MVGNPLIGIRKPVLVAGSILAVMIVAITIGNVLVALGLVKNQTAFETPAKIAFFTLFVLFGFSLVPIVVRLVLGFQVLVGNGNLLPVRAAVRHAGWIVAVLWALMAAGLATALPAAIREGFFANESSPDASAAAAIARIPVQGTLVAVPGMRVRDMLRKSTLRLQLGRLSPLFSGARYGGAAVFDFRVAGTKTTFARCRYYYVTTDERRPDRIAWINVGISAEPLTRAQLGFADRLLSERLRTGGWASMDGLAWRKDGIVLNVRVRRLDDQATGESPAPAGRWVQFIELREKK